MNQRRSKLACNNKTTVDALALKNFANQFPMLRVHSYPLSGGLLSETIVTKETVQKRYGEFEFAASEVHLAFPSSWHIVDMFSWMYHLHPLRHHTFAPDPNGIVFDMTVICFRAEGERAIYSLRSWLRDIFIPLVWPDLLREAMKIIAERKACLKNPESSEELLADRSYLGTDPTLLSFYKRPDK